MISRDINNQQGLEGVRFGASSSSSFCFTPCAFSWGITAYFTVKFREHSWEITTTATTDYKNVSYSDWYKVTIDGKPTEFILVPVGPDAVIGDVDPESDTKTYYTLALPLYVKQTTA